MLIMLLLLAAEPVDLPSPHKLAGPINTLFSADDYPKEARRHHWQGTVVADITVSEDGDVVVCNIVESSGYQVLDDKTCEIFKARARFIPAKDANGQPTEDVLRTPPITWRLAH